MAKEKEHFLEKYLISFFWIIFLVSSVIGIISNQIIEGKRNNYGQEFKENVLVFDHTEKSEEFEGKNILVFKYDVDGETYTYKEISQSNIIPKSGDKFKCYYNQEIPQEIIKTDNEIKDSITQYLIVFFFIMCFILSIIGAKLGGIDKSATFSAIPLAFIFIIFGFSIIVSLFFSENIDLLAIVFIGGLGLFIIGISGYALFCLIKETVNFCRQKSVKLKKE